MKKDNVELICSISELSNLFKEKGDITAFLKKVVQTIAKHMHADVCSIYLLNEEEGILELKATEGLNQDLIGTLSLSKGEGLVGLALKELRPILEENASRSPYYKFVPGSGEETFDAFLAVPILMGMTKIGVLTLQHQKSGFFNKQDVMALKAIASQLAATLENVRLLISVRQKKNRVPVVNKSIDLIKGIKICEGIAFGKAFVFDESGRQHALPQTCSECYGETLEDFRKALNKTEEQLEILQTRMEEDFSDVASLIFSAHILMLKDESFSGAMENLIETGSSPFDAIIAVSNKYIEIFSSMEDPRFQEKTQDIQDLGHRLLKNLSVEDTDEGDYTGQVIIAEELLPSELIKIAAQHVEGLVFVGGNASAHVSILAKSLGVPCIVTSDRRAFRILDNQMLILDAHQGNLIIEPSEETLEEYKGLKSTSQDLETLGKMVLPETKTADGKRIRLLASINLLSDLKTAKALKAEGIGLYRSEFPFLIRNDFPSEEEQFLVYKKLIDSMDSDIVTLRALDIGGDKILSYLPDNQESNPFLGLRAIRFLLQNKKIFVGQLKAMLRAGEGRDIRILFPLISSLEDFLMAKRMVKKSMEFLDRDGLPYSKKPRLGVMVELPSAVEMAEDLAAEADFISIGTNDLVQYMLGVDRTNDRVSELYQVEHPAIIRAVRRIRDAAFSHDCDLTVCGNLTSNLGMVYYFAGLGIEMFSLNAAQIPRVQQFLSQVNIQQAREIANQMQYLKTTGDIRKALSAAVKEYVE